MNQENNRSSNWGGARENAGRKSTWNHKETCTIRIPKVFAPKLHEIAQKWDKNSLIEFDTNSSRQEVENGTESSQIKLDSVSKTSQDLSQAIDLAEQILRQKKAARISLAKFLSKLYNFPVKIEDLS
ncbi:hypothetical protein [Crocosphaera watsonii]|uniref:hypothetical protein n=1 Tax=Crocosphaera watsonii TaxID=263511 RepID=UPI0030D71E83